MKKALFTYHDAEERLCIIPETVWGKFQSRKIRLLLTNERVVLLTKENIKHILAVTVLTLIAVTIAVFLLAVLHIHHNTLPLVLLAVFALASNIHLQYRFRNPRLHRVIREIPLSQISEVKKINDMRLMICADGKRELTFIMQSRDLRQFIAEYRKISGTADNGGK